VWAVGCIGRGALACSSGSLEAIDIVNCVWPPDCGQRQRLVEVLAGVAETASRQMVRLSRPSLEPRFGHDFSIWKKLQSSRCIHSKQQRTEQNSEACSSVSDNQCGRYGEAPLTDPGTTRRSWDPLLHVNEETHRWDSSTSVNIPCATRKSHREIIYSTTGIGVSNSHLDRTDQQT